MASSKLKGRQIETFTQDETGVVNAPITVSGKFLRDDNTWQTVTAGSGSGLTYRQVRRLQTIHSNR